MALEVFVRGIEHWRWEADPAGRLTPRFRLRCRVETPLDGLPGSDPAGEWAGPPAGAEETLERLRHEIRLSHYSLRTEQCYPQRPGPAGP